MEKQDKGFVALIDVLGFASFDSAKQRLVADLIVSFVDNIVPQILETEWQQNTRWFAHPDVRAYSDTIVLIFQLSAERRIAQDVFYSINTFIGRLLSLFLLDGILLRGAIGYGDVHVWKYGVYGSAVIDVKSEFEQTDWSGVHYGNCACSVAAQWLKFKFENKITDTRTIHHTSHSAFETNFVPWIVPFKSNVQVSPQRFVVPWPKEIATTMTFDEIIQDSAPTPILRVLRAVEPLVESGQTSLEIKGRNTRDFVQWYLNRFNEFNVVPEVRGQIPPLSGTSEAST